MHTTLLSDWVRAAWIIASCAVAWVHLRHVWAMTGQRRYWHVGHVMMALGMAYMYLPAAAQVIPDVVAATLFTAAAAASAGAFLLMWGRGGGLHLLWLLSAAEMAVMAYMVLPMNAHFTLLSHVLAGYLVLVGVSWVAGARYSRYVLRLNEPVLPTGSAEFRPAAMALRLSLATMAASMAYMLVAM